MRWKNIIFSCVLICLYVVEAGATDTLRPVSKKNFHTKLQFAGSIGFLSVGAGITTAGQRLETDVWYGYVPQQIGGTSIHTASAKITWAVLKQRTAGKLLIKPFTAGLFTSYTFGKQYFAFAPEQYSFGYYGYPTALHAGLFLGGQVGMPLKQNSGNRLYLYYELGTTDTRLASYFTNIGAIPVQHLATLAVGVKHSF